MEFENEPETTARGDRENRLASEPSVLRTAGLVLGSSRSFRYHTLIVDLQQKTVVDFPELWRRLSWAPNGRNLRK